MTQTIIHITVTNKKNALMTILSERKDVPKLIIANPEKISPRNNRTIPRPMIGYPLKELKIDKITAHIISNKPAIRNASADFLSILSLFTLMD